MDAPALDLFLSQSPWMACLTDDEVQRVRQSIAVRSFSLGSTVCPRGAPSAQWIGVVDGLRKLDNITEDGKTSTFAGVPAGAWFGEGTVLKDEARPYAVTALSDSVVVFLPRSEFMRLLHENHAFALWLIGQLNASPPSAPALCVAKPHVLRQAHWPAWPARWAPHKNGRRRGARSRQRWPWQ